MIYIPLRGLPHVSNKVLLPDNQIDDPGKGSRSFKYVRERRKKKRQILFITFTWFLETLRACRPPLVRGFVSWICSAQIRDVLMVQHAMVDHKTLIFGNTKWNKQVVTNVYRAADDSQCIKGYIFSVPVSKDGYFTVYTCFTWEPLSGYFGLIILLSWPYFHCSSCLVN